MGHDVGLEEGIRLKEDDPGRMERRLRFIMQFSLAWVVFIVTLPDFVMGLLKSNVPWINALCDFSAVAVMAAALLYLLFKIKQERRVMHLLACGVGLLVISQGFRIARVLKWLDFLHEIRSYDWYHAVQVFDNFCNGLGLVMIAAAFLTAIVDLFAAKHRLAAQQEALSEEVARRARTEEEILREKQKYQELVNNLPVGVYRTTPGPEGRFLEMNPAHVAMFEADSEAELFKQGVERRYKTESKRHELSNKLLRQGFIKNEEVELVTLKGRTIWGSITAVVKHDPNGKPYFDGIIEDITARVHAERLLAEQRAKLAESARLASLGTMAAGIAHEINNPLAIIAGCIEQLEACTADAAEGRELSGRLLPMIQRNIARIKKTIQGLRALSRDASEEPFASASMAAIIEDTLVLCQERFRLHGICLEVEEPVPAVSIECRPSQICQVLLNLLNNSFDALKNLSSKWIRIMVIDTGNGVEIAVEDSGPGIPEDIAGHLFVPFFTTKPVQSGLGLGLSISRVIAEAHHGELAIDSSCPHTRFVLRLPKRQPPPEQNGVEAR